MAEARKIQTSRRKIVLMSVKLVLFGQSDSGTQVGTALGRFKCYLQHPDTGMIDCLYDNPQSLQLPDLPPGPEKAENPLRVPATLMVEESEDMAVPDNKSRDGDAAELVDLLAGIEDWFDKLPAHRPIAMAAKDSRVLTALFHHQQEALDFMVQREVGSLNAGARLWEFKTNPIGEDYGCHGARQKLTTLALIVSSLERARDFASRAAKIHLSKRIATSCKATMVIVPSELLLNTWAREIERHLYPGSVRYVSYHGQERQRAVKLLSEYDIVLTTYGTVLAEYRRLGEADRSPLHQVSWFRLILDEAHTIRNWSSKQFNAVCSISSQARWCLTGTPIQNSLDDLGSLIKFLGMPIFNQTATFRKYATKVHHSKGATHGEFKNLQAILSSICLRRSKTVLPNQEHCYETAKPEFTTQERREYRRLELACKRAIAIGAKGLGDEKTHQLVMEALLRLWIGEAICAHCSVDILSIGSASSGTDSGRFTPCGRLLCSECYADPYQSGFRESDSPICPLCHGDHEMDIVAEGEPGTQGTEEKRWPSKIEAIVQNVQTHYLTNKCVIFSFWKKTLDVLGDALKARNIHFLRVDGDVPVKKRHNMLQQFQTRTASRVLLMTFSTGGVGLNGLTVANMVHLVEPQWNPAVEKQAIGRVMRLDQQNKVTVFRYAMQRSIEEVVQSRQLRKLQLASGGFRLSEEKRRELKSNQLQHLQEYLESSGSEPEERQ
ncbi:SNF2 family N-terminal domain-containing protein [Immersiella caudata]|uniref:SNF2 family N-terminal domain-containing protein n=1 Tax=Immersiella caudata TaxID=314043 RepID=A0AA39X5X4_9PEZI|nr:SNF2 family N-terminal domain-containing protein [Immersiella caudata]